MAKLGTVERMELKGAMCRIIHIVLEIDTRIRPSLKERIDQMPEAHTQEDIQNLYDQYIEDVAEEYIKRIERD